MFFPASPDKNISSCALFVVGYFRTRWDVTICFGLLPVLRPTYLLKQLMTNQFLYINKIFFHFHEIYTVWNHDHAANNLKKCKTKPSAN